MKIYIFHTQANSTAIQELDCPVSLVDTTKLTEFDPINFEQESMVFYQSPSRLMADLLRAGLDTAQAISRFDEVLGFQIKMFKASRSKVRLIAMDEVESNPEAIELGAYNQTIKTLLQSFSNGEHDLYDLAASLLITKNRLLLKLSQQLAACSILPFLDTPIDIEQVVSLYSSEQKIKIEIQSELKKVKSSNTLVLEQLHQVQEELEKLYLTETQLTTEVGQLSKALEDKATALAGSEAALQTECKALSQLQQHNQVMTKELKVTQVTLANEQKAKAEMTSKLEDITLENELIIKQLHQVQEELEKLYLTETQLTTEVGQLSKALEDKATALAGSEAALQTECKALSQLQQHNQVMTKELKATQVTLANEQKAKTETISKLEDVTSENELIIEQLHQVQEELEYQFISKQELVKQYSIISTSSQDMAIYNAWIRLLFNRSENQHYESSRRYRGLLKKQLKFIQNSELIDSEWYLTNYPDLKQAGIEPALHYLQFGAAEGRNPSVGFNTLNYIFTYKDVAESGMNPLVHFLKFGQLEGREADPRRKCLPAPKNQGL